MVFRACLGQGCSQQFWTLLVARPATMKAQCQSTSNCLALWLESAGCEEDTQWWLLGFQVKDYSQDRAEFANWWCCWLRRQLGPYLHEMLHKIVRLVAQSISIIQVPFFAYYDQSYSRDFACYSVSYHSLAVSAEAWHAILYLIMPLQYQQRFGNYSISYQAMTVSSKALASILFLTTPLQYLPLPGNCSTSFLALAVSVIDSQGLASGMWFSHPFSWLPH